MAQTVFIMDDDKRLEQISEQIVRYANADFQAQGVLSEKGDQLDSIVVGLNLLGEELESYVHQLKSKEEQIKKTLLQLTEAQHLAHIGSWDWDIPNNTIYWSDELYRIYGVKRGSFESTFENYLKCAHPEDREYVNAMIGKAYQDHQPLSFFHRILHSNGSVRYIQSRGEVFLNDKGAPYRMSGTAQDITETKQAEEKMAKLAAIVESSSDAIISKTVDGYIMSWNKEAAKLFGYSEEEALGKHISLLFPVERLKEEETIIQQMKAGHPLINYETERKKKDGTVFPISATISPIKDTTGKLIGISKIVRDITERKRAEEKLLAYTTALEQKHKETEQFAYIASHDLQEPLRTITNYIGLLVEEYKGKLDESADLYINFIDGAARRMQTLIVDLLDYTRIENDVDQVDVDCNALVNDVLADLETAITESNASVQVENLPVMSGYQSRLKSLFQNLISNALKFKKAGVDPVVKISAKDMGKEWRFEIKDNGIGIEKTYFEKIFMLFQRLHARSEYNGTGLGLAHCKKIVELRGGRIWVESEPGKGSSFYFTLPKKIVL
jgi:PAS domain S-box-containing protein